MRSIAQMPLGQRNWGEKGKIVKKKNERRSKEDKLTILRRRTWGGKD